MFLLGYTAENGDLSVRKLWFGRMPDENKNTQCNIETLQKIRSQFHRSKGVPLEICGANPSGAMQGIDFQRNLHTDRCWTS